MLHFLPGRLKGILAFFLIVINTIIIFIPIMIIAVFKLILPINIIRNLFSRILIVIANQWVRTNSYIFKFLHRINWDVKGIDALKKNEWCLVISNHQTWVDIFVLQTNLLNRVPYIKFFLKKELIWVPLMGLAWWALDFPFMERYSRSFLEKNPHLRGKDVEKTRKACDKFKNSPVSIMNFVEGTRFTTEKHKKQQSPFKNLLKPKAGGVAFVLGAMGEHLDCIVDFTISYPEKVPGFWDFLCGRTTHIKIDVKKIAVTPEILGNYDNDPEFKQKFQIWVNDLWEEKDKKLENIFE
ncbi:MAG: acyltransferase [Desulfobacterales bacterium]|nr:acyltransferase [Desulfobacterales bacterium]MCP4163538.1 acyltransferase [Deltaproteobacteria bacterium]